MLKQKAGSPALAFMELEPLVTKEVQMPRNLQVRPSRRFLEIAQLVLGLVLLVLKLAKQILDLLK